MESFISALFMVPLIGISAPEQRAIHETIRENLDNVTACYPNAMAEDEKGRLVLDWEINEAGAVTKAVVNSAKSTFKNATNVSGCLVKKVKGWRFPASTADGIRRVSYPFNITDTN